MEENIGKKREVIVTGGGAAGMMAAVAAADAGAEVILIEKNEKPGKKLYITGKGRCNVTNNSDIQNLLLHVVSNPKFLYSAFSVFYSKKLMDFLESEGLKLKQNVEAGYFLFRINLLMLSGHLEMHLKKEMLKFIIMQKPER